MKPFFIINSKTYKQATGKRALKLVKACKNIRKMRVMVALQATDLRSALKYGIPLLAQHVDYHDQGRNTGKILPEAVKQAGAKGTFINHSENPLPLKTIEKTIKRCKALGLLTLVCVPSIAMAKKVMKFRPDIIAYEIPELVATGKSITKIKPEKVKEFSSLFTKSKIIPLCGAGISSREDVRLAIKLGCKGALLASAVVKAKNPSKKIKELVR
jgi:triosephosphate isomerase